MLWLPKRISENSEIDRILRKGESKMKKLYEEPKMETVEFDNDVIVTSYWGPGDEF